jgi:hypothetical protein
MKALAFRQLTVPSDVLQHVVEDVDVVIAVAGGFHQK